MDATNQIEKKPSNKRTYIVLGIVGGTLVLAGVGVWYFFFRKGADVKDPENDLFNNLDKDKNTGTPKNTTTAPTKPSTTTTTPKKTTNSGGGSPTHNGFPLKKRSKGALVKQMQEALIKTYGKSILPRFGADSDFGSETENALVSKGFPVVVDLATFTKIVSGSPANPSDPKTTTPGLDTATVVAIASTLKQKAEDEEIFPVLAELKKIRNVQDYKNINAVFRSLKYDDEETDISAGLLDAFDDANAKALLMLQFVRIGLKAKDGNWQLAGLGCPHIKTHCATTVKNAKGYCVHVPAKTVLGTALCEMNGTTTFRTLDNQTLYVPTKDIIKV